ncbi:MAG: F0F1 ATP synthase subunit epsilon [Myxococcota bacterium]
MKLVVATPLELVVDADDVREVRAEDPTGLFGVRPGHAAFLTVLVPSVLRWTTDRARYVAVRGGVLSVRGDRVDVATREAVVGDVLDALEGEVLRRFAEADEQERVARTRAARLEVEAVRRIALGLRARP